MPCVFKVMLSDFANVPMTSTNSGPVSPKARQNNPPDHFLENLNGIWVCLNLGAVGHGYTISIGFPLDNFTIARRAYCKACFQVYNYHILSWPFTVWWPWRKRGTWLSPWRFFQHPQEAWWDALFPKGWPEVACTPCSFDIFCAINKAARDTKTLICNSHDDKWFEYSSQVLGNRLLHDNVLCVVTMLNACCWPGSKMRSTAPVFLPMPRPWEGEEVLYKV